MYSPLCNSIVNLNDLSNTRGSNKITTICIHHMAGVMSGNGCAEYHKKKGNASANIYIGVDGDIVGGVSEELRAWTTANIVDYKSITIEVSNCEVGGLWPISTASYNSLIAVCADICNRYAITPEFKEDASGSMVYHGQFGATACCGPTLIEMIKSKRIENDIKSVMQDNKNSISAEVEHAKTIYRVQVGAFAIYDNAKNFRDSLIQQGYSDAFIQEVKL